MTDADVTPDTDEASEQEPAATGTSAGRGDHPDPDSPPAGSAPGTAGEVPARDRPEEASNFKDVLEAVDPAVAASQSQPPEDDSGHEDEQGAQ